MGKGRIDGAHKVASKDRIVTVSRLSNERLEDRSLMCCQPLMLTEGPALVARELVAVGDELAFVNRVDQKDQLWFSDATPGGTRPVMSFPIDSDGGVDQLMPVGNIAVFTVDRSSNGFGLWRTDGTAAGTTQVTDFSIAGDADLDPLAVFPFGNNVVVAAKVGEGPTELWNVDLSTGTRIKLREFDEVYVTNFQYDIPPVTAELAGQLYFRADDGTHGAELWTTDGTPNGTRLVIDLVPGKDAGSPAHLTVFDQRLFFCGFGPGTGGELWSTDGTESGTQLVRDLLPGARGPKCMDMVASENWLYMMALGPIIVSELEAWEPYIVSDGTSGNTRPLDSLSGYARLTTPQTPLLDFQGSMIFGAITMDSQLNPHEDIWLASPTDFDAQPIWHGTPLEIVVSGEVIYFIGYVDYAPFGEQVWAWREGGAGAVRLTKFPFRPMVSNAPSDLIGVQNRVFFTAGDGIHGRQLYTLADSLDGDLDWDGDVDSADMVLFLEGWTGAKEAGTGNVLCSEGDFDQDQDADSADLLLFLSSWTGAQGASGLRDESTSATSDIGSPAEEPDAYAVQPQSVDVAMSPLEIDRLIRPSVID